MMTSWNVVRKKHPVFMSTNYIQKTTGRVVLAKPEKDGYPLIGQWAVFVLIKQLRYRNNYITHPCYVQS